MPTNNHPEDKAQYYLKNNQPEKAVSYLIEVGCEARRQCANNDAIQHYRRAIEILPDQLNGQKEEFFEARLGLGQALKFTGDFEEAGQVFSDTLDHLQKWEEGAKYTIFTPTLVRTLRELGDVKQRTGAFSEAKGFLEKCFSHLSETTTRQYPALAHTLKDRLAWIHFRQGDLESAISLAHEVLQEVNVDTKDAKDSATLASLYNTLGGICYQQGKLDEAITNTELSLNLYRELNFSWGIGVAYTNLGVLYDISGNWLKAVDFYKLALKTQKQLGDLENQARSLDNLGALRMAQGDYESAGNNFNAALEIRENLGEKYGASQSRANLAQLALSENNLEEALSHASASLELAKETGGKEIEVWAGWVLALVEAENEEIEKALATVDSALQMAQNEGFQDEEIDCLRTRGILIAKTGDFIKAEESLRRSLELSLEEKDPYREGLAHLNMGLIHLERFERDVSPERGILRKKTQSFLQAAKELFESLGSFQNLIQCNAALKNSAY